MTDFTSSTQIPEKNTTLPMRSSLSARLRYPPSPEKPEPGANAPPSPPGTEALWAGGERAAGVVGKEGAARIFSLLVSLAHVHNISAAAAAAAADGGEDGGDSRGREGLEGGVEAAPVSSQLHVELGGGGREVVVTARRR